MKWYRTRLFFAVVPLIVLIFGFSAAETRAALCTWSGAADTDWHNAANWTGCGGLEPQASDDVTIPNTATLPTLTLVRTIHDLTIQFNAVLTINNDLTLDGQPTDAVFTNSGTLGGTGTLRTQNTVTILGASGIYNADLNIIDTATTFNSLTYAGGITIDPLATLNIGISQSVTHTGNLTNNGTLAGLNFASNFNFQGANLTNNSSIVIDLFDVESTCILSGTGTWTGNSLIFQNGGNVTLANNVAIATGSVFTVNGGSSLDLNGFTLTRSGGSALFVSPSTVSGGTVRTQGAVTVSVQLGVVFTADFNIDSDTTTFNTSTLDAGSELSIDPTATLQIGTSQVLTIEGDLINNGTVSGINSASAVNFNGVNFTNNASVTIAIVRFDAAVSLAGTGTWTGTTVSVQGTAAVTLQNNLTIAALNLNITSSASLNLGGFTLTKTGGNVDIDGDVTNGTFRTDGTVTTSVLATGTFTTDFTIGSGTTNINTSTIDAGTLTVSGGATLNVGTSQTLTVNGDLVNDGTISGNNAASRLFADGANFTNNSSITIAIVEFNSATNLSGTGTWTGTTLAFFGTSNVILGNNLTVATGNFDIGATATLDLGGFTLTRSGGDVDMDGTLSNGTLRTQGTVTMSVGFGGTFSADLNINTGTNTIVTSTFDAACDISIDGAAELIVGLSQTVNVNGNLTNDGTISGLNASSILTFNGTNFVNNGSVTIATHRFGATSNLSGNGTWTGINFQLIGAASVTLLNSLTVAVTNFSVAATSSLDLGTFTLTADVSDVGVAGSVSNGLFRTQGTVTMTVPASAVFTADFTVNTGTTTFIFSELDAGSDTTVDPGATLNLGSGQSLKLNGNLINNGDITGNNVSSVIFFDGAGATCTNNSSITISNFNFRANGEQFLTGSGSFGGVDSDINVQGTTTLSVTSDHTVRDLTVLAGGTLNLQNGILDSTTVVTMSTGTTIQRSDGSLAAAPVFGGFLDLVYAGSNPITTGPELPVLTTTLDDLTMNNSSGVTLSADAFVGGVLTLNAANISTGAFALNMRSAASASRTAGHIIGTMRKTFGNIGTFTFDLGTANGYSPMTVQTTAGTHPLDFTIRAVQGPQPNLNPAQTLQRYWDISTTSNPTANLTFNYLETDVAGTESQYRIIRVTGGVPTGFSHNPPNVVINTTTNVATINDVSTFSDWNLGQLAPSAADVPVGGRVLRADGKPVSKALIRMLDESGDIRYALTNPFGYYHFQDVPAGRVYTFNVRHKLHRFAPRVMMIQEENLNLNFTATPD